MTKKEYTKVCRIKVEHYAKLFTYLIVICLLFFGHIYSWNGWLIGAISTTVWFFMPDVLAFILESYYHIKHNYTTYR